MLQDLATSASTALATISMLFFVAVYAMVVIGVVRAEPHELEAHARLALDDEPQGSGHAGLDTAAHE